MKKIKRNDPCECGSGKKYKKCCMLKLVAPTADFMRSRIRRAEGEIVPQLEKHAAKYYGDEAFVEAVEEYFCWHGIPRDEHMEIELAEIIVCWFYFNWIPNNDEAPESQYLPERTIALDYLQRNLDNISAFSMEFIEKASGSYYSFYLIESVSPGETMVLKDILLERTFTVVEKSASFQLEPGQILYSRIITLGDTSVMLGSSPFPLPATCYEAALVLRKTMHKREKKLQNHSLFEWNLDIRDTYLSIRESILFPPMPEMRNSDNEPLEPMTLYYDLFCSPQEALDALKTLTQFKTDDELLLTAKYKKGQLQQIMIPWLEKGNKQRGATGLTLMAELTIDGAKLKISVNSENRADRIQRKITRRLGRRASFTFYEHESVCQMMAQAESNAESHGLALGLESMPPEMQETMAQMARQHWDEWLTIPVPALKNKTPREAAKTKIGRERLTVLLLDFESRDDPVNLFAPDVDALRRALGLM